MRFLNYHDMDALFLNFFRDLRSCHNYIHVANIEWLFFQIIFTISGLTRRQSGSFSIVKFQRTISLPIFHGFPYE